MTIEIYSKYNPIKTNTPGRFCFPLFSLLTLLLLTSDADAQNKYRLIINMVTHDTPSTLSDSSTNLQQLDLQTSFNNRVLCTDYIYQLPQILSSRGYVAASVDSVYFDSVAAHIYLFPGPKYTWLDVKADSDERKALEQSGWSEKKFRNKMINFNELQSTEQVILNYYESIGYPFAQIKLDNIQINENLVTGRLRVDKGVLYHIDSVRVYGKAKIKNLFLQHYLDINNGSTYSYRKLQNVSRKLQKLPYLQEQQPFDVTMLGTGAILNLYLMPKRSNEVNFLVGFLPGNTTTGKPQLTGDIHLDLKNSLGSGESILVNWQQLQPKSPRLNLGYRHPYIFNSAFGIDFAFDLLKKDSVYLQLHSQLGIQYILSADQAGKIFLQNERAYLLQGGYDTNQIRIVKTLPPDIDVSSNNIGIDYELINTNYALNPRKGNEFNLIATIGLKKISKNNDIVNLKDPANIDFDFNSLYDSLKLKTYQVRATVSAAHYFATAKKSTLKIAVNSGVFQSQDIFRNELFRIGGYRLLRGFDEESIYANQYAVFTAEYRYLAGINSYVSGFTDIGFTRTHFQSTNFTNSFIGAGLGLVFETKFGLLNLSYAVGKRNDVKFDINNSSKIHFGYINYF